MPAKTVLFDKTLPELEKIVTDLGSPKFRAKQIYDWLAKGVNSFDQMKNLPTELRAKLKESATPLPCEIIKVLTSSDNSTHKLLLNFNTAAHNSGSHRDTEPNLVRAGRAPQKPISVETVLMQTRYGNSVCISSQAGCASGCKFCASTLRGFQRNLTATEMLAQVAAAQSILTNERISHVVIMGTGEPLMNINNTIEFIERLNNPSNKTDFCLPIRDPQALDGLGAGKESAGRENNRALSYRRITLSTCGIPGGIDRLTDWGRPINLAISLHAPTNELRSRIMPINEKYPLEEIMSACDRWQSKTKRQLTLEYIVLKDTNDSPAHARELADLIGNRDVFVNLIPYNPVPEREFSAPSNNAVHRIKEILDANKIPCKIRYERGQDIASACGQLRNQNQ